MAAYTDDRIFRRDFVFLWLQTNSSWDATPTVIGSDVFENEGTTLDLLAALRSFALTAWQKLISICFSIWMALVQANIECRSALITCDCWQCSNLTSGFMDWSVFISYSDVSQSTCSSWWQYSASSVLACCRSQHAEWLCTYALQNWSPHLSLGSGILETSSWCNSLIFIHAPPKRVKKLVMRPEPLMQDSTLHLSAHVMKRQWPSWQLARLFPLLSPAYSCCEN